MAIDCTALGLMQAAACYQCLQPKQKASVMTYLLCEWLKKKDNPPVIPFSYTPATSIIAWVDSGGPQTGDLATFRATADVATVDTLNFPALFPPQPFDITSIQGLSTLPSLNTLNLAGNLVETLDCSACSNLTQINANGNQLGLSGGNINVTGCASLQQLTCGTNPNLASIVGISSLANLGTLTCSGCAITSLDVHGCGLLLILDCSSNQLGTLNITGDFAITTLNFSSNPAVVIIGP